MSEYSNCKTDHKDYGSTVTVTEKQQKNMENQSQSNNIKENLKIVCRSTDTEYSDTATTEIITTNHEKTSMCSRILSSSKLNFFVMTYMTAYTMKNATLSTIITQKVCAVHLNYSENVCDNLQSPNFTHYLDVAENLASFYNAGITLTNMIPSFFIACILGPWSDTYGRKIPLIIALFGVVTNSIGSLLCAHFMSTSVEYLFIPAIISGFSGGNIILLAVFYSFVSDSADLQKRTLKYALLELSVAAGASVGSLVNKKLFNYITVFSTSLAIHVSGIIYAIFIIDETRGIKNKDSSHSKLHHLFSIHNFKESFKAMLKKRPNQGTKQILLLMSVSAIVAISKSYLSTTSYVYTLDMFNWDNTKYSKTTEIFTTVGNVSMVVTVIFLCRVLKLTDPSLGLVGVISYMSQNIVTGIAKNEGIYYLGNVLGLQSGIAVVAARSHISKIISKNDSGKVFVFLSTAESIIPVILTVAFTQIFRTAIFFPALEYLVIAGLLCIPLVVYAWLACLPEFNYEEMTNDQS